MLIDTNAESVVRTLKSEKQQAECTAARAAPIVFPRGRPFGAPAGTYSRPVDTPTPRRGAGGERKALWYARRRILPAPAGPDAPTPARIGTGRPMGRSIASSGDRRFPKGERKALWCARRRIPPAPVGLDAPTPAREKGLQPYGALTLFFRWRKKSVQKKASGTATPGKSPLLPILTAGLAMSRAA